MACAFDAQAQLGPSEAKGQAQNPPRQGCLHRRQRFRCLGGFRPPVCALPGCSPPPQIPHHEFIRDSRLTSCWGIKTGHYLNIIP